MLKGANSGMIDTSDAKQNVTGLYERIPKNVNTIPNTNFLNQSLTLSITTITAANLPFLLWFISFLSATLPEIT